MIIQFQRAKFYLVEINKNVNTLPLRYLFIRHVKSKLNFEEHKSNIEGKRKIYMQRSGATKGK